MRRRRRPFSIVAFPHRCLPAPPRRYARVLRPSEIRPRGHVWCDEATTMVFGEIGC